MIYLISDPHGGEEMKGLESYLAQYKEGDILIILGDLSLNFGNSEENRRFTQWFLGIDKPIMLVDGNHENHAYLNAFPEEALYGGKVNRITPNIIRLQRGYVFCIEGNSIFVMGGCKSSEKWKTMRLWYDGEEPSREEIARGYENLTKHGNKVDFVLTHLYAPDSGDKTTLAGFEAYINETVEFKHWYAGHWHIAQKLDEKHTVIYSALTELK